MNIFSVLKSFSKEEVKGFRLFLLSPYHNRSKKLLLLFSELIRFYPDFDLTKSDKVNLFKKIEPVLLYNDSTYRNMISDLQKLLEQFLMIDRIINKE